MERLPEPLRSLVAAGQLSPAERESYIEGIRRYLASTSSQDPNCKAALSLICETMEHKFSQSNSTDDANASVWANTDLQAWLQGEPNEGDTSELAQSHHNLALAYSKRHKLLLHKERTDDLNLAIQHSLEAVSLSQLSPNPERPQYLTLLGDSLRIRSNSQLDSAPYDIEEAVKKLQEAIQAIQATEQNSPNSSLFYDFYGLALQRKYSLLGNDAEALHKAVEAHQTALNLSISPDDQARCLSNLANARVRRFDHYGATNDEDLNLALRESRKAVELTKITHYDWPGRLTNLANALQARSERGHIQDLYEAVEVSRNAVGAARSISHGGAMHTECLASLGVALHRLFDRTNSTAHLVDTIATLKEALSILQENDGHKVEYLFSLGSALSVKYRRYGDAEDFEDAVQVLRDGMSQTPSSHTYQLIYKTALSNLYSAKYQYNNQIGDLDECVRLSEEVAKQSESQKISHYRAAYLTNLGGALFRRSRATRCTDLNAAIDAQQEALRTEYSRSDHPLRANCLHNLGLFLADRYIIGSMRHSKDRIEAIRAHREASQITTALPSMRIKAARRAMHLLQSDDVNLSADIMKEAIETLQMASPVTIGWEDQQNELAAFAGLASRAAALTLEAGRSDFEALRLLELGRGVMATLQLDLRTDIQSVALKDKELASRFEDLRSKLNTAPASLFDSVPLSEIARGTGWDRPMANRYTIFEELQCVIREIRELPGLSNFMDTLTEKEMIDLASQGPIVAFNVDPIRSDALIVKKDTIVSRRLSAFKFSDLQKYSEIARNIVESSGSRQFVVEDYHESKPNKQISSGFSEILEWLWRAAVQPVLAELGIHNPIETVDVVESKLSKSPQRIWWVTGGPLSTLPIHAAGIYGLESTINALDLVVSSYVPTLKSLWYARKKLSIVSEAPLSQALLINMQNTPHMPLAGAGIEIDRLKKIIPPQVQRRIPSWPSKSDTLQALQECQICHFACHGLSHPSDPSRSRLVLMDDEKSPLTVGDLVKLDLSGAQLAYLSACSAADNRVTDLLDESLHLAAAFLLAGFPSVVGTLWRIKDSKSADVAADVYQRMKEAGSSIGASSPIMSVRHTAESLNSAIRLLRKSFGDSADAAVVWTPYIHLGM